MSKPKTLQFLYESGEIRRVGGGYYEEWYRLHITDGTHKKVVGIEDSVTLLGGFALLFRSFFPRSWVSRCEFKLSWQRSFL